jgi:hemerythrin superfamily protein
MALFTKKPRTEGVSDPVKLLITDHQKVERIFEQIEATDSPAQRRGLVVQLESELTNHTLAEEDIVYPFIRERVPDGSKLMDEAENEHEEAKEALLALSSMDPADEEFPKAVAKLKKLIEHHVKEEENDVFPKLDESVEARDLNFLRGRLEQAKFGDTPVRQLDEGPTQTKTSSPNRVSGEAKAAVWVQPHTKDDAWQVRRENASRASRVFDSQSEAEQFGRKVAKREKTELVVAGRDGSIREKRSYGNDPSDVKG